MVRFDIACTLPFGAADFWRVRASPRFLAHIVEDGLLKRVAATPEAPAADGWTTRELSYVPARVECPAVVRAVVGDTAFGVTDCQRWREGDVGALGERVQEFNIRPDFLRGISKTEGELVVCDEESGAGDEEVGEDAGGVSAGEEEGALPAASGDSEGDCDVDGDGTGSAVSGDEEDGEAEGSAEGEAEGSAEDEAEGSTADEAAGEEARAPRRRRSRSAERCLHTVRGEARVSLPTVGWFVERAIAHNLRQFYRDYPASVGRFRDALVDEYAHGELKDAPLTRLVDRMLEDEAREAAEAATEAERAAVKKKEGAVEDSDVEPDADSEAKADREAGAYVVEAAADALEVGEARGLESRSKSLEEATETLTPLPSETKLSEMAT